MGETRRFEDWEQRLWAYVQTVQEKPFAWGTNDCCLFVADAIEAMTGIDPAAHFRGSYSTREEAYRVLFDHTGAAEFHAAIQELANRHAFQNVPVPLARRGDLVAFEDDEAHRAVGIVALDGIHIVSVGPSGLTHLSLSRALHAWRI